MTCCHCSQSLLCLRLSHLNHWKSLLNWISAALPHYLMREMPFKNCLRAARRLLLFWDKPAVQCPSRPFTRYTPKSTFISSGAQKKQKTWEVNCTPWTLYLADGFFNDVFINDILGAQTLLVHFWMRNRPGVTPLWKLWKLFTEVIVVQSTVACHYHRYFGKTTSTFSISHFLNEFIVFESIFKKHRTASSKYLPGKKKNKIKSSKTLLWIQFL